MNAPNRRTLFAIVALCGILSHHVVFRRFEVDTRPLLLFSIFAASPFALHTILTITYTTSFAITSTFLASLFTSILIYRAYFHPLRHFPGPPPARLTKLWALYRTAKSGLKWHQVNASLHVQYGHYVRTGPRELSISDPAAMPFILGFGAKPFKGPVYDSIEDSVNTTRDRVWHAQRRRVWDSSFKSLLSTYPVHLTGFTSTLLSLIRSQLHIPIDMKTLALHYGYDVATQLAFGQSVDFLGGKQSADATSVIQGLNDATGAIGLLYHVPWMLTVLGAAKWVPGPLRGWNQWSNRMLAERQQRGQDQPDLMGYLIANTPKTTKGDQLLFAESRVIITAGSDTTATALTTLFTLFASSPSLVSSIRSEIDPLLSSRPPTFACNISYPILDSIINETLRLYPPVLFASQRCTLDEGLFIPSSPSASISSDPKSEISLTEGKDGVWIPPHTVFSMPTYVLHHSPLNFVRPMDFIPERWTTHPELILNRQAFIPFSMGVANCPGKGLATMEIRDVVARVLGEFDVCFADEGKRQQFDMEEWMSGTGDHFVAALSEVRVMFSKRER